MTNKVVGIVNCYNNPELGQLTENRPLASTAFLGRYAFVDFPLSNFFNSGIDSIGILCQKNISSLIKHVGNGRPWTANTKIGNFQVLFNEECLSKPGYNTDVNCILENDWFFRQVNPQYVVIAAPNMVYSVNYAKLLEEHIASGDRVTMLYTHVNKGLKNTYLQAKKIVVSPKGKLVSLVRNNAEEDEGDIFVGSLIMDYEMFKSLVEKAKETSAFYNLDDIIADSLPNLLVRCVKLEGLIRDYDSLPHVLEYSLELTKQEYFDHLFKENWPIHTRTYDTAPTLYRTGAVVKNSFLSNGCDVAGEVTDSIVGRGVIIKKGAVIKHCIISTEVVIGENVHLENVVVDRNSKVLHVKEVVGTCDDPVFVKKGETI